MISDIFNIYQKNRFVTAFFQTLLLWYVILLECMLTQQVATKRWTDSFAGLVLETEDGFRLRPENFLAEGERDLLEKILKAPYVFFHLIGKGTWVGVSLPWFSRKLHYFMWLQSDWSLIMRGRVWFVNVCGCSTSSWLQVGNVLGLHSITHWYD